ncbi:MAG TPA: GNAT family N-acetyltransferase [Nanoarchaeota archaeon]|nr:GNAT family N-acetyltransferase [Nanoarchaeota archaeon]
MTYIIANEGDLEKLTGFLSRPEIDLAFIKPLSSRAISIAERVYSKYKAGLWALAIDEGGNVAGCCALIPREKEVEISTYAVSPEHQGHGIGSALLDFLILEGKERYNQYKTIIMDSWEGNKAVERIMQKTGFVLREAYEDPDKRPPGVKTVVYERGL